jgi:hypothetical protein
MALRVAGTDWREMLRRLLIGVVVALLALYVGDLFSLELHIPRRDTFGVVKVDSYTTVPRKDGRLEYYTDAPVDQKCVRSLFPHMGYLPCWYVQRTSERRTNL